MTCPFGVDLLFISELRFSGLKAQVNLARRQRPGIKMTTKVLLRPERAT